MEMKGKLRLNICDFDSFLLISRFIYLKNTEFDVNYTKIYCIHINIGLQSMCVCIYTIQLHNTSN